MQGAYKFASNSSAVAFWLRSSGESENKDWFSAVLGRLSLPHHPDLLLGHLVQEPDLVGPLWRHRHLSAQTRKIRENKNGIGNKTTSAIAIALAIDCNWGPAGRLTSALAIA